MIDPTANVIASITAEGRRIDQAISGAVLRQDNLRENSGSHLRELAGVRAGYDKELRDQEAKRINDMRTVDTGAFERYVVEARATASTLAASVTATAEAMRSQVAALATSTATTLANTLEPFSKNIETLTKNLYEQQGQKAADVDARSDPILLAIAEMKHWNDVTLGERRAQNQQKTDNQWAIPVVISLVMLLLVFGGLVASGHVH